MPFHPSDNYKTACRDREHRARGEWAVVQRECNHSAFNGYRRTPSAYSTVTRRADGKAWRASAAYVRALPDAT